MRRRNWHRAARALGLMGVLLAMGCSEEESAAPLAAQGVYEKEIVIGTHQDLSGPIVSWGEPIRNGLVMALDDINAAGGVHGRRLRLIVEDTGYEPRRAVLAVRKLIDRDRVFAVVAPLGSPTVLASMPLVLRKGILHLFPFTGAEGTYRPLHPLKFSGITPYTSSMRAATRYFVDKFGVKRAGILYQDDDFGLDVRRGAEQGLADLGLKPVAITTYKRGATDFSTQVARLRAAGADFLILGTVIRETIGAAQAARDLGWDVPILCSLACYAPEVARLGGAAVQGIHAGGQFAIPYDDDPNPGVRAWIGRYREKFGVEPNLQAISAYQLMRFFGAALERAGPDPTQEGYARALEAMPPWRNEELSGVALDFTETDHLGSTSVFISRIVGDRWEAVTDYIPLDGPER